MCTELSRANCPLLFMFRLLTSAWLRRYVFDCLRKELAVWLGSTAPLINWRKVCRSSRQKFQQLQGNAFQVFVAFVVITTLTRCALLQTGYTEKLPREIVGLGSVTVASFDAFARVRDASEEAAREVLTEGSAVASDVVALR
jgi:hypothetical protein